MSTYTLRNALYAVKYNWNNKPDKWNHSWRHDWFPRYFVSGTKKRSMTKAASQADGDNMLWGSDGDRGHQYSSKNALRKRAEEGQGHAKQACPKTPSKDRASLQQQNAKAEEADGM